MADVSLPTLPSLTACNDCCCDVALAAATIVAGNAVVLDSSGNLVKADRDTDDTYAFIALNGAVAGQPVDYCKRGKVAGWSGLTPGVCYFLSDTAGALCPIGDISAGQNYVPVGIAKNSTVLDVLGTGAVQLPNNTVVAASPAQGDLLYYNGSAWAKLAAGTKGQYPGTGGAGANPSYMNPRSYMHIGPLADQGAGATVTLKLGNVPTGRVWVPLFLCVQSGTTAGATAQLKAAGSGAMDALALDGDTETSTFTDNSFAAGQAITIDLVTVADTGDLDSANVVFAFADLPA